MLAKKAHRRSRQWRQLERMETTCSCDFAG